jgi:uracil-DNA glycosylase
VIEFDPACTLCPRLAAYLAAGRERFPHYHCAPVGQFGVEQPHLVIVGLAPGFHGANATGRPFTGDHAGILLYRTLHEFGLATATESRAADDDLRLIDCRITNAVKCAPPGNKPLPVEVATCNRYLTAELGRVPDGCVIVALGAIAHGAVLAAVGLPRSSRRFAHGAEHALPRGLRLLDSYHCSRYNTQTRRLTADMFRSVMGRAAALARAAN